jgi:hypothetical protein
VCVCVCTFLITGSLTAGNALWLPSPLQSLFSNVCGQEAMGMLVVLLSVFFSQSVGSGGGVWSDVVVLF